MTSEHRLHEHVALVTGASRGLGRHIARHLAAAGAVVAVNYAHDEAGAAQTVREIREAGGVAQAFRADVTDRDAVVALVAEIEAAWDSPVRILINNATGPQPGRTVQDSNWGDYLDQLRFFVEAPLHLLQAVLPGMRAAGSGSVVNIGSDVVQQGLPRCAPYVAAKAAMVGLTRSWASELGPEGIRVNLVAPGWVPVERHAGADTTDHVARVPLGRVGAPADIAETVTFLASPQASFITGQCLSVNGGVTFE